jgi:predicted RNA-binding Zn-ribbon protein involved in translation (DUF1610 family)
MTEAWIQLTCPECGKDWEVNPSAMPDVEDDFTCPDCAERRPLAEFTRTQRDFEIVATFSEA